MAYFRINGLSHHGLRFNIRGNTHGGGLGGLFGGGRHYDDDRYYHRRRFDDSIDDHGYGDRHHIYGRANFRGHHGRVNVRFNSNDNYYNEGPRYTHISRDPQIEQSGINDEFMRKAVSEAYVAAAVIDSNPAYQNMPREEVKRLQAEARSIRSAQGQTIIGNENFPFVNSEDAAKALDGAYVAAGGNPQLLGEMAQVWGETSRYKRGPERDEAVHQGMYNLVLDWEKRGLVKLSKAEASQQQPATGTAPEGKPQTASVQEQGKKLVADGGILSDGKSNDETYLARASEYLKSRGIDTAVLDKAIAGKQGIGLSNQQSAELIVELNKSLAVDQLTDEQKANFNKTLANVAGSLSAEYSNSVDAKLVADANAAVKAARGV